MVYHGISPSPAPHSPIFPVRCAHIISPVGPARVGPRPRDRALARGTRVLKAELCTLLPVLVHGGRPALWLKVRIELQVRWALGDSTHAEEVFSPDTTAVARTAWDWR
jgi:hypothetical protein